LYLPPSAGIWFGYQEILFVRGIILKLQRVILKINCTKEKGCYPRFDVVISGLKPVDKVVLKEEKLRLCLSFSKIS
jgi:hypothetical protein